MDKYWTSSDWSQTMICYLFTNQVTLLTMKGIQTDEDSTTGMFGYGVRSLAKIPLTSPNPILLSQRTHRENPLQLQLWLGEENPILLVCLICQSVAGLEWFKKQQHLVRAPLPSPWVTPAHQIKATESSSQLLIVYKQWNYYKTAQLKEVNKNISKYFKVPFYTWSLLIHKYISVVT